ncbi:MAG: DHA2 family efflux MFS transporter permease subunit [Sphingomonadaceae bacterium]
MHAVMEMSPRRRLGLTIVVMAATLIQVLDSTIANVALPHMQASLGAAPDTITWVLTSYIVAAAVATPTTGWLETRFGRRNLMALAVTGFTVASILCGLSTSLQMIVLSRLAQGLFGAFISPLSQAIMLDIYPEKDRPKAMSIWGTGVMIGPIIGPVLGGVLTDAYSWRWVFFINVPVGICVLFGIFALLEDVKLPKLPFDAIGFSLLALGLGAMQLVLDRGTQLDWLDSIEIIIEMGACVAMLWMFAIHTATARNPLIPRSLFRDRNFVLANLFFLVTMGVLIAAAALLPPMLQTLFGYSTTHAGLMVMPRGVAMMVAMFLVGRLSQKIDPRILVATGMALIGASQWMMTGFSLGMDERPLIVTGLIQGFGFGLVMVPMNLLAFATLAPEVRTNGAAVWSLSRNIGGSITIAMFTALAARNLQVSHSDITGELSVIRYPFLEAGMLERYGMPSTAVLEMVDREVNRQAMMITYLDSFWLMAVMTFALIPLTLLLRVQKNPSERVEPMVME